MQHNCYDLGILEGEEMAEVMLSGNAANVRLMERKEYYSYKTDKQYKFYGGLATQSPYHIIVPHGGHWYIVVDMKSLGGTVMSSMKVITKDGVQRAVASVVTAEPSKDEEAGETF